MSLEHSPARHSSAQEPRKTERQRLTEILKNHSTSPWTVLEWCAMRRYARGYFYTLRRENNAPDTIGKGKAQRITDAADARWVKLQERKAKKARDV